MVGAGSAGPRSAGAAAGVEAEFVGSDGVMRREPLRGRWNVWG